MSGVLAVLENIAVVGPLTTFTLTVPTELVPSVLLSIDGALLVRLDAKGTQHEHESAPAPETSPVDPTPAPPARRVGLTAGGRIKQSAAICEVCGEAFIAGRRDARTCPKPECQRERRLRWKLTAARKDAGVGAEAAPAAPQSSFGFNRRDGFVVDIVAGEGVRRGSVT